MDHVPGLLHPEVSTASAVFFYTWYGSTTTVVKVEIAIAFMHPYVAVLEANLLVKKTCDIHTCL